MGAPLVELLEALAGIFEGPGPLPRQALRSAGQGGWAGPELARSLARLAEAPSGGLGVAYADHFLVNSWHPVLHLESSVLTCGHLADPEVLSDLAGLQAALGGRPASLRSADHLSVELETLAGGLRTLAEAPDGAVEAALRRLGRRHLLPHLEALRELARDRPMAEAYEAALAAAEALVREILEALDAPGVR